MIEHPLTVFHLPFGKPPGRQHSPLLLQPVE
jgi:hypothetical protein